MMQETLESPSIRGERPVDALLVFINAYREKLRREHPLAPQSVIEAWLIIYEQAALEIWAAEGIDPGVPLNVQKGKPLNLTGEDLWEFLERVLDESLAEITNT
jgi:hypothetical protein